MKIKCMAVAVVSLFVATVAHGQYFWNWPANTGPYFNLGIGPTIFQDSMIKSFTSQPAASIGYPGVNGPPGRVNYDVGFTVDGDFGYAFNKYISAGFDTGYVWGRMDSVQNYQANDTAMANVPLLATLTLSLPIPHTNIVPYIGGGVGGSLSILNADNFTYATGDYADGSESDLVFAYEASAGVRFMINPNLSLGIGYQYFATGNPTFDYTGYFLPDLYTEFQGVRTHSIMFTLHLSF